MIMRAVFIMALLAIPAQWASADYEEDCGLPPIVGAGAPTPNVIIVYDYSGSMTDPAHTNSGGGKYKYTDGSLTCQTGGMSGGKFQVSTGSKTYDPAEDYYGTFKNNTYYKYVNEPGKYYWEPVTLPTAAKNALPMDIVSSSSADGGAAIEFTTSGNHELETGDVVIIEGLDQHSDIAEGNPFTVTGRTSTTFTIAWPWNGTPDTSGTVKKRINGSVEWGISGNLLNFVTHSRTDVVNQALVGGILAKDCANYNTAGRYCMEPDPSSNENMYEEVPCESGWCLVKLAGSRYKTRETTNVHATFYVRPAELPADPSDPDSPADDYYDRYDVMPDGNTCYDYQPGCQMGLASHKDMFIDIEDHQAHFTQPEGWSYPYTYLGEHTSDDFMMFSKPAEIWTFTTPPEVTGPGAGDPGPIPDTPGGTAPPPGDDSSPIDPTFPQVIRISEILFDGGEGILKIGRCEGGLGGDGKCHDSGDGGITWYSFYMLGENVALENPDHCESGPCLLDFLQPDTTYYVRVAPSTYRTQRYILGSNVPLTPYEPPGFEGEHDGIACTGDCFEQLQGETIGNIKNARLRIRVQQTDREESIIYDTFDQVRYGFIGYNTSNDEWGDEDYDYYPPSLNNKPKSAGRGRMLIGCHNAAEPEGRDKLARALGDVPALQSTPSGEALEEAMSYLRQVDNNRWADNSDFIDRGNLPIDPYYWMGVDGAEAIACRQSFVILISDGEWNGSVDPDSPAYELHTTDLRNLPSESYYQTANVYSIMALDDQRNLKWALKAVAAFGGFNDEDDDGLPYTWGTPGSQNSKNNDGRWIEPYGDDVYYRSGCVPGGTYNDLCREWDRDGDGIPDGYFEASDGDAVAQAMRQILLSISQNNGTAGAVAATSQQGFQEGDIIVRGMAEVTSSEEINAGLVKRYLWFGHLEAYFPYPEDPNDPLSRRIYDFQKYPEDLCVDRGNPYAGDSHCWDGAHILELPPDPAGRNIFTYSAGATDNRKAFNTATITADDLGLPPQGTDPAVGEFDYTTTQSGSRDEYARNLINYVRGDDTFERDPDNNPNGDFRYRGDLAGRHWPMGDIMYSTPIVIGRPVMANVPTTFEDFDTNGNRVTYGHYLKWRAQDAQWHRPKVVYVGANDGMLHAFLMAEDPGYVDPGASDAGVYNHKPSEPDPIGTTPHVGAELWAYIPSNLLTELKDLANPTYGTDQSGACAHRAMVDLSPDYKEVFFHTGGRDDWHTILLGGQRGGGDIYFAIDVTDPFNPAIVWEYSILKDMVVKFDVARAWPAFEAACGNFSYHPGQFPHGQCEAPLIPSSIFNGNDATSRCDECLQAEALREQCIIDNQAWCADQMNKPHPKYGSIEECLNDKCPELDNCEGILRHYTADQWFMPFDVPELYEAAKTLPMSWSRPAFGRIDWPDGMTICTSDPAMGAGGVCGINCDQGGTSADTIVGDYPRRTVAFVGVAMRLVDENINWWYDGYPKFFADGFRGALEHPTLLVLDIELGVNLFRYVWPEIMFAARDHPNDANAINLIPVKKRRCDADGQDCETTIPYALSDCLALDVWDGVNDVPGVDSFTDRVYVGDMNGLFYEVNINFDPSDTMPGVLVNLWHTKPIIPDEYPPTPKDPDPAFNVYRSHRQPITARPSAAWEDDLQHLRVVFGTGKLEKSEGGGSNSANDKSDPARMSFYNLRRLVEYPVINPSGPYGGQFGTSTSAFYYETVPQCLAASNEGPDYRCICPPACGGDFTCPTTECPASCLTVYDDITGTSSHDVVGCKWTKPDLTNDCCEDTCPDGTCWTCIFDLIDSGEKVITKPLIYNGFIWFVSSAPTHNPCAGGGKSFLYAFQYECKEFPPGVNPLETAPGGMEVIPITYDNGGETVTTGVRGTIGQGFASEPVLPPGGDSLVIQSSNGDLMVLGGGDDPPLVGSPVTIKGWLEHTDTD
jgi:type IV pilus assembly protein PilY1